MEILFFCELLVVFTATIMAVISDFRDYKINNRLSVAVLIIGVLLIITRLVKGYEVTDYILGMCISFAITFALFFIRGIGAGDAKLLTALGCVTGYRLILRIIIISLIAGAVIGVVGALARYLLQKRQSVVNMKERYDWKYNISLHIFHLSPAIFIAELVTLVL